MKQANSKLAALTLITTLAVTSVIGTTVHANGHAEPDQAVAGNYNPITNDYIKKPLEIEIHRISLYVLNFLKIIISKIEE